MVELLIEQGDKVRVSVADGDGSFDIEYSETQLTINAELPGSHVGNSGLIYREVFAGCSCDLSSDLSSSTDPKCPKHGKFACNKVAIEPDKRRSPAGIVECFENSNGMPAFEVAMLVSGFWPTIKAALLAHDKATRGAKVEPVRVPLD